MKLYVIKSALLGMLAGLVFHISLSYCLLRISSDMYMTSYLSIHHCPEPPQLAYCYDYPTWSPEMLAACIRLTDNIIKKETKQK